MKKDLFNFNSETNPADLRRRKRFLEGRVTELDRQRAALQRGIEDLRKRQRARAEDLAEGKADVSAVSRVRGQLAEKENALQTVAAALENVRAELVEVDQVVALEDREVERERQIMAARKLQRRIEKLKGDAAAAILKPMSHLTELAEAVQKLQKEFPLVGPVPLVEIRILGDEVTKLYKARARRSVSTLDCGRWYTKAILAGPMRDIDHFGEVYHVKE